ncbi:MAG: hypothetical protein ABW153_18750 [Sedimenticola sp.]
MISTLSKPVTGHGSNRSPGNMRPHWKREVKPFSWCRREGIARPPCRVFSPWQRISSSGKRRTEDASLRSGSTAARVSVPSGF